MDYKEIGLRVGLEIHQQLEGRKLFCSCPTQIIDTEPDYRIKRNLRASAGETGEIDEAAKHEQMKEKHFIYYFYNNANCLVELDEEPPHPVNKDALETCWSVAKMLNAKVIDEIVFMRKTVIDGSNVSGFQRTALIAADGWLETPQGKISIATICLEEDAAKIVEKKHEYDIYNLSRLGIPLIEIATGPDINSPEQAKECAEKIGMLLRSTQKVKRGIGTIRQDINISIKDGNRIEIKGAQELNMIPLLVENEIKRQQSLIKIKNSAGKINWINIRNDKVELTELFKNVQCNITLNAVKNNGAVFGLKLNGLKGFLSMEIQPGRRLGTELSDYAKIKAGVNGLFHSDELPKYGITEKDVKGINKKLNCSKSDAFVLIADEKQKVLRALDAVYERALKINEGVLKEVRNANPDGTTSFLRPMPGAARMYPETDIPLTKITKKYIGALKIPELITEKASRMEEYGLSKDLAELLAKKDKVEIFEKFVCLFKNIKPSFIAEIMLPKVLEVKRKYNFNDGQITRISDEYLEMIFDKVDKNEITKEAVEDIFAEIAKTGKIDFSKYREVSINDIESDIKQTVEKNKSLNFGALMGIIMAKYRGKVDGKKISEILKKYLNVRR